MSFWHSMCSSAVKLEGKTAIITGSNTGIGKVTAKDFYERGARVILACRNQQKAQQAANDIENSCAGKHGLGKLVLVHLDLTSLASVRDCATKIVENEDRIDLLINNAGVMVCPQSRTDDGFEMQFGTNHLGPFLFTLLLLRKIVCNPSARIVNVSSVAHKGGIIDFSDLNWNKKQYNAIGAYAQSKLANILFTKELARRLKDNNINNVTVYSLHPGVIDTDLARHINETIGGVADFLWKKFRWMLKTPSQGAQTTIYCAVDDACGRESGLYYAECAVKKPTRAARNDEDAAKLWTESLKLVNLPEEFDPFC